MLLRRRRSRRRLRAREAQDRRLAAGVREHHKELTQIFLAEKTFEGCGGLEMTDEMRVTIAGLATLMILGMPDFVFDNVHTIPRDAFRRRVVPLSPARMAEVCRTLRAATGC